jgi:AraC-like DNA-binding protein
MISKGHERLRIYKHVTVETHVARGRYPIHWHNFFEIEIVVSGKGRCVINDVSYDIAERNVFFLSHTDFHYHDIEGEATVLNISFDEEAPGERDMIKLLFNRIERAYFFDSDEYARLTSATELLRHECDTEGESQSLLLRYVIRCILQKNPPLPELSGTSGIRGIKKAIVYMELHFKEKITLEGLAAEAGYHPTYFSEIYKKTTGETYIEALTKLRVGHARTMLANGFSVSEACFLSGFGSLSGFASAFKRACFMSPREYKRLHGTKNQ